MAFVLDASVTCAWLFEDEATPETDELIETAIYGGAYVPALWKAEMANVLVQAARRGRTTSKDALVSLGRLDRLGINQIPREPEWVAVAEVALKYNLSAYDAIYLLSAMNLGLPLATLDKALRVAAQKLAIETLPKSSV